MLPVRPVNHSSARLSPEDAAALLSRAQSGDRTAANDLCTRYLPYLEKIIRRDLSVKDLHDREDISQKVLEIVLRPTTRFSGDRGFTFESFLYRIARNESLALYREKERQVPSLSDVFISGWKRSPYDVLPDHKAVSPERQMIDKERWQEVDGLIERLPVRWREVIKEQIKQSPQDVDVADIAREVNRPRNTVGTWLYRARHRLQATVEGLVKDL